MKEILISLILLGGSFFIFIAALGIVRLPDLFIRMHASAKASSFGIVLLAIAVGIYFPQSWILLKSLLIILFIFLTAPISAHMIARAAYFLKIPLWKATVLNELENRYDFKKKVLRSTNDINQ